MRSNKYNLTHYTNTTCNMGELVPIGVTDTLIGDRFKHNTSMFMRFAPMANPIMHPVKTYINHFYVPYRLIWDKWEDFITGGEDFDDESEHPYIDFSGSPVAAGSLANQLGLPVGFEGEANALPFRAYALIYNEIYRDDQIQAELGLSLDDGVDTGTSTDLMNTNWSKDPFISARPNELLGVEASIPLGDTAPIIGIGNDGTAFGGSDTIYETDGTTGRAISGAKTSGGSSIVMEEDPNNAGYPNIRADLSGASGVDLDVLRQVILNRRHQEIINMTGNRYEDYVKRHGVGYNDGRLQRPEHLAGGKQTVQFSEVLQTGVDSSDEGVGKMKGHGIAALRSNDYFNFFPDSGLVISLMCTKPIPMYMQALPRMWSRQTRYDYWQKEQEMLMMQEITNKEIKHDHSDPDGVFGYQPKYDEYRRIPNTVKGEFATVHKDWHLARDLTTDMALNSDFITCNPTARIFEAQENDKLYCTVQHKIAARRLVGRPNVTNASITI